MYLTISKRFEFSASHRCHRPEWTEEQNFTAFGKEAGGKYGHGHNYVVHFVFHGSVDSLTGMMINVMTIKERIKPLLDERYDHKYFNVDTPPFDTLLPTAENLAGHLLKQAQLLFAGGKAQPVACHLIESSTCEATAYADGRVERHLWIDFSAARRTYSPHLSDEENKRLFGIAASPAGHGHNYRLRVTLGGMVSRHHGMIVTESESREALETLHVELDHRNLNQEVPDLAELPMTTEVISRFIWERLEKSLPVRRVRLYEKDDFFAEYLGQNRFALGIERSFYAAHRLHCPHLSDEDNRRIYDKCNNPSGHGHQYRVECTIGGELDIRSGTVFSLERFNEGVSSALESWDYKHLDLETDDFGSLPSTGENIVHVLWPKISQALGHPLYRLRLSETSNNRFALRTKVDST